MSSVAQTGNAFDSIALMPFTNQNNLAFPVARALANTLGAWFDPLLLADITANRKPGFTINCVQGIALTKKLNLLKNGQILSY